ncbi:LysR family transcriptional regulator [Enhygromyxa salina]|uniref:HTH-type transcriptional regulator GltC n=1 Tax=Enhygromyxa salina TaxID=215803 RepID=A0A2S9XQH9_9BACT|nr:LysR family transcriptional regulator [Enhygromyxa salina]PRP95118.1 HTH-type transcriptional regulator GltC [Enhygromyxa salina]
MQLNRLEGFYWVGHSGGYAAAARAMPYPITQPAVYQQVKRLEEDVEFKLFERVGRGDMRLTPGGQALFDFIAPFFVGYAAAIRAARANATGGLLRIQAAHQLIRELLPGWVAALTAARPGVQVEILEAGTVELEALRRGDTDLLIDHVGAEPPSDIGAKTVAVTYGYLIAPAELPGVMSGDLAAQLETPGSSLTALRGLPFIAYSRHLGHHEIQREALGHFDLAPQVVAYLERAECITAMVAAGVGYSFIPSMEPNGPQHPGVRSYPIAVDGARFPVVALWREAGTPHPLIELMLSLAPSPPVSSWP